MRESRYIPMTHSEVWNYLKTQKLMYIATITKDGRPHNTPVWYIVEDHKIYFRVQPYKKKLKSIGMNTYVSASVASGEKYTELKGVSILARSRILKDERLTSEINNMLLERYRAERNYSDMPPQWRSTYENEKRVIVELEPHEIFSWDNSKWISGKL
jgi:nitroimidazol reductase NimA-like FMN-containing flavoprotein (pyridoxamine 5'-phosphate oxidase superfamily)